MQGQPYSFDPSSPSRLSSRPLLQDPYEKYFCCVAKSIIARGAMGGGGGGEGVFAVTDILEGTIVGFYNGIRKDMSRPKKAIYMVGAYKSFLCHISFLRVVSSSH